MSNKIVVLGAGMVGTACALQLQRAGMDVTLIDRSPEVKETSYGNAGMIATSSVLQLNNARLWRSLPSYINNRSASVRYRLSYVLRNMGWMVRYLAGATEANDQLSIAALSALIKPSLAEHESLMAQAGISHRLKKEGWLKLYRKHSSYTGGDYERACLRGAGVDIEELDRGGIRDLEPDLNPLFEHGIWIRDSASVDNPGAVTEAYRKLFVVQGGKLVIDQVSAVERTDGGYRLMGTREPMETPQLVVALGPWSNNILAPLQVKLPLVYERGYHQHFNAEPGKRLNRTIYDADGGYVLAPMEQGYRLSSGVELAERDAPPTPDQLTMVVPRAREAFNLTDTAESSPWLGSRPSLPDSMPVIGPVAKHYGLWLCTGHGHIGFSTGPVSGRILAAEVMGQTPDIDIRPFLPSRFGL